MLCIYYLQAWWLTLQKFMLTSPFTSGKTQIKELAQHHTAYEHWSQFLNIWLVCKPHVHLSLWLHFFPPTFLSCWLQILTAPLCWSILSVVLGSILCSKYSFCMETSVPYLYLHLANTPPNLRRDFHSPAFVPLTDSKLYSSEWSNCLISPLDCKLYECRTYPLGPSLSC